MNNNVFKLHARFLQALAHPRRLEIVHLLRWGPLAVDDVRIMVGAPQANISQHLKILRDAGVVQADRKGKTMLYRIADRHFIVASDAIREFLIKQHKRDRVGKSITKAIKQQVKIARDPVCGMKVTERTAGTSAQYHGTTYVFCADGCKKRFQQYPRRYVE